MNKKALIAMSGGVDSSVAAARMLEEGYDCVGATVRLYDNEGIGIPRENTCCTLSDVQDAREVALRLNIPYYVFNFKRDFAKAVIDRFVQAYERGETPNPCIDCNRYLKFQKLYQRAKLLACDTIVTGHYAQIEFDENRGRWLLKKARNADKDQSYVLYFMTQQQLACTRFPLGIFEKKDEVRALAEQYGFSNARKRDSQDICFVQGRDYAAFIERYTEKNYPSGPFVDSNGQVLGTHRGIIRYTVGQRKGLGLSLPSPLYVCEKCPQENAVVLCGESGLYSKRLVASDFNWIAYDKPKQPIRVTAKTRYRAKEAPATAFVQADGTVELVFDEPQRAVTEGQAVVLYEGDSVAGGGTIQRVIRER